MNFTRKFSLACILASPQILFAVEPDTHRYTAKEQIVWSASAERAFDRTGKYTLSSVRTDGSGVTELNGSMMSVTVARLGPDGKIETYCTSSAEGARAWMAGEFGVNTPATLVIPAQEK